MFNFLIQANKMQIFNFKKLAFSVTFVIIFLLIKFYFYSHNFGGRCSHDAVAKCRKMSCLLE